ncbi:MAG: malonate decarboxylase holo-[acyl-carrier-protein] synthase [Steroidobacteraceae bacterium]
MSLQFRVSERPRRHDLVFVTPKSWRAVLSTRKTLATDPLIAPWVDNGWPLIGRRAMPADRQAVPLGLPLPPGASRRRLSMVVQPEDIVSIAAPPALDTVCQGAPRSWQWTLDRLDALAARYSIDVRVCGSLAWSALTGLDYLTDRSDLDVLLYVNRDTDVCHLTSAIAGIEEAAPMRLDGELIRDDGAAVSWREFHHGTREILVKTVAGVALIDPTLFLSGNPDPFTGADAPSPER